jgi:1-aminocyclopropane-1-carboxylate deaminase/D-cysteine desulfhydrase-like pyridoxal-dependent ACC family enzyme
VTGSGLFLGKKLLDIDCPMIAVAPIVWPGDNHAMLTDIANRTAELLGVATRLTRDDINLTFDFIGPGYGAPSRAGMEATRLVALTEGILLDPVYTAKAFAALVADIRAGKFGRGQNVVFIHTGGTPAMFAYQQEYVKEFAPKSA